MSDEAEIKFRGAALGRAVDPNDPVDPILEALLATEVRVGDRIYPPWYASSLGRFRAPEDDVRRMRRALRGIPRVDPEAYDILFNAETREWVIVKWVRDMEPFGFVGRPFLYEFVCRPFEVYEIDARRRSTHSLSEKDWEALRSTCITLRGRGKLNREVRELAKKRKASRDAAQADEDHDFLGYHHALFRKLGEQTGLAYATPAEMAARYGGRREDWDPDHIPGVS